MSTPLKLFLLALLVIVLVPAVSIVVPNVMNARERGKQKRTMSAMRSIATGCESYSIDNNQYPNFPVATTQGFDELMRLLEPTYGKEIVRVDGWGTQFIYQSTKSEYTITSFGADRLPDSVSSPGTIHPNGGTRHFNADIIFSTGSFTQFPDGTRT